MKINPDKALRAVLTVPAHIDACANAIRYDLMHGPSFSRIPAGNITRFTADDLATFSEDLELEADDLLTETYAGPVGDALKAFIDDLPSTLWYDADCDDISTSEPEAWEDEETGEMIEPYMDDMYQLERRDIIEALFGRAIAHEFR